MGLRNAFEEVATESLLRQVLRAVSFSKDINERLRVIVDNQIGASVYLGNTTTSIINAAQQVIPFSSGSWNVMDAREPMRDQSLMAFQNTRNRWTIT